MLPPGQLEDKKLLQSIEHFQRQIQKRRLVAEMKALKESEEKKIDPLARTGKLYGAMINDIKRRYSIYMSDLKGWYQYFKPPLTRNNPINLWSVFLVRPNLLG